MKKNGCELTGLPKKIAFEVTLSNEEFIQ